MSNQDELICEESLQTSRLNLNNVNENTDDMYQRSLNVVQSMVGEESDIVTGSSFTIIKDILKDQLREIKKENVEQFTNMRKTIEKNEMKYKEQYIETEKRVEKICKGIQEAITSQRRETKKRFERLEKKSHSR